MRPTLTQIMSAVEYLPWKTVGKVNGVPYLDLVNELGADLHDAGYMREQLTELERRRKVVLLRMDPPNEHHVVAVRPR